MKTKHAQQIRAGVNLALLLRKALEARDVHVAVRAARLSTTLPDLSLKAFQRQRRNK